MPALDYADIIYDKPFNQSFKTKLEIVRCKAALGITGAIKETFCDRLHQELGLESLADKRWSKGFLSYTKLY